MPMNTTPSIVCSPLVWEHAVLLDPPRELSDLQEQRLSSLIRTALNLYQDRPNEPSIVFDVLLPVPDSQPTLLSLLLEVIESPTRHPALLITLGREHH